MKYRQCRLRLGSREQIAFIPEQFARIGNYLELRGENGWLVVDVFGAAQDEYLTFAERGYRKEFASL